MARHISQNFLNEFLNGSLKYILDYIHKDHTLDMELRGNEVTIYYRGGKLFSIREDGFELKYLDKKYIPNGLAINKRNIKDYIPEAKQCMDTWFATIKENWEKEIQQQIVRENNYSPTAEDTDYFIIDIEYEDNDIGRFDIVALRWDSTQKDHKFPNTTLTIFELKQGYKQIDIEDCGIVEHYNDFNTFKSDDEKVVIFKKEMIKVFEQKRELGLIPYLLNENMKDKKINEVNNETFSDTIFEKSSTDMRKWFYRIHLALND